MGPCEIESSRGRPGKAGKGLRDFDGTDYTLKEASKSRAQMKNSGKNVPALAIES
jgi:hypothetical protein